MSDRKLAKAVQSLFKQIWRLHRSITKATVTWLLRAALLIDRKRRYANAGFVLPTTVLLILVVTLTAGAITYRAFNTSSRTIAEAQNRVIYNAATPAIDRARSKLEFLFDANRDTRLPSGVPSEDTLVAMLLNGNNISIRGKSVGMLTLSGGGNNGMGNAGDPYTLPDETRVDINQDGRSDNAWSYRVDTDGNGTTDATVVYSILLSIPPDKNNLKGDQRLIGLTDAEKMVPTMDDTDNVRRLSYVRHGPLANSPTSTTCRTQAGSGGAGIDKGWYQDATNTSTLRKNFQVDAFVVPDNVGAAGAGNFTTLEFNQDRRLDRGNKWGAWFRNDLEIFPGPQFNWNGAMHTEGSLIIGGGSSFSAYLISAPSSCLFYESASEITITNTTDPDLNSAFRGVLVSGTVKDNGYNGSTLVYLHSPNPTAATSKVTMAPGNDWSNEGRSPYDITLDPVAVHVRNGYRSRVNTTNEAVFAANNNYQGRIKSNPERAPYVDDTYRADNRYGPKLRYNDDPIDGRVPPNTAIGAAIPSSNTLLRGDTPTGDDFSTVGLDGYWERRARNEGLRLLVSERLELGNTNGWKPPQFRPLDGDTTVGGTQAQNPSLTVSPLSIESTDGDVTTLRTRANPFPNGTVTTTTNVSLADPDTSDDEGDPLYPPHRPGTNLTHESIQRRALRDNIAGVQSTAVYHAAVNRDYPVACMATTAHPGSPFTLRQSLNFVPTFFVDSAPTGTPNLGNAQDTVLLTDFFNGRGTNGWEFEPPLGSAAAFEQAMNDSNSAMRIALTNLAQFAGDHVSDNLTGAFPPTQRASEVHPYSDLTMWGNFSNLRRTIAQLNSGTTYSQLSPADKTYLQTAACTLGILAYNIDRVQHFDPRNPANDKARVSTSNVMFTLARDLYELMDGRVDEAANNFEVLPKSQLATYAYNVSGTYNQNAYNPRDYDRVPAEAFLGKLREKYLAGPTPSFNKPELRLAELIFTYFQVRRDRTYGFRPSPASNTWNYNPYVTRGVGGRTFLWSSACDPNMFAFRVFGAQGQLVGREGAEILQTLPPSVGVSRLALSRLCGTVISPGAVHDYPGDYGLPQRNTNNRGTAPSTAIPVDYIPRILTGTNYMESAKEIRSPAAFATTALATSPLWNRGVYLQATVAPKWPSLYYIFPEFEHNHDGTQVFGLSHRNGVIDVENDGVGVNPPPAAPGAPFNTDANWSDDVDQRQPTGRLRDWFSSSDPATGAQEMVAAFQPWQEEYVVDSYIRNTVNNNVRYRVVDSLSPAIFSAVSPGYDTERGGYETGTISYTDVISGNTATYRYRTFVNPLDDRPVAAVAIKPRRLPTGFTTPFPLQDSDPWQLPVSTLPSSPPALNTPPNRILAPDGDRITGSVAVVPFLDRVMFNGREGLPARVLDIDLGMLRRTRPANQSAANKTFDKYAQNDVWLPVSGIIYAFREDGKREDAIARPASGTVSDVRNPNNPTDPSLVTAYTPGSTSCTSQPCLSVKSVDGLPDPERQVHGFRLRNGSVVRRHPSMNIPDQDNYRGLSFFTDNPVYIMGDFNLHQAGADNDTAGTRLEEFTQLLPDTGNYTEAEFYANRTSRDTRFADPLLDRWRPSEILADAISVVSDTLCDGSAIDTFMTTAVSNTATITSTTYSGRETTDSGYAFPTTFYPYRSTPGDTGGVTVYANSTAALFGPGCTDGSRRTTFMNQNRPSVALPTDWSWLRENPNDLFSPIKVSRNGQGAVLPPLPGRTATPNTDPPGFPIPNPYDPSNPPPVPSQPRRGGSYVDTPVGGDYYAISDGDGRPLQSAQNTRVNAIVISGLTPSRVNQSYGGLHNFPRFLETWTRLWFAGSFLQLNFSNYATAPFDLDATEPAATPIPAERINYYGPPSRLWGYDVALQLASAGPAASRFVTSTKERNEFYAEPPVNDPYIRNLCLALPNSVIPDNRCPS